MSLQRMLAFSNESYYRAITRDSTFQIFPVSTNFFTAVFITPLAIYIYYLMSDVCPVSVLLHASI